MTSMGQAQLADEWLSTPPKGWHIRKLKDLCYVSKSGVWGEDPLQDGTDTPVIRTADVRPIGVLVIENAPLRQLTSAEKLKAVCRPDDLLVVKSSGSATNVISGKSAQVTAADGEVAFSNFLLRLRPRRERAHPRFVFYVLHSHTTRQRVLRMVSTTTYPNLKVSEYLSFPFLAPDPSTQKAIADFLDKKTVAIDALIEKKQALLTLLAEKRAALINQAVTKGLDPNVPMKDSGIPWIGDYPKHWAVCRLSFRYEQQLGKMLSQDSATGPEQRVYLGNKDVQWDYVDVSDLKSMSFNASERAKFNLRRGDLLVCEGGMVGRTAVWREELADCFFQKAIHRLRPVERGREDARFFYYVMRSAAARGLFEEHGNKSTIGHLTGEALRAHRFPFPPKVEQSAIAQHLDTLIGTMKVAADKLNAQIRRLQEYRQALITAAVTGQLDIGETA